MEKYAECHVNERGLGIHISRPHIQGILRSVGLSICACIQSLLTQYCGELSTMAYHKMMKLRNLVFRPSQIDVPVVHKIRRLGSSPMVVLEHLVQHIFLFRPSGTQKGLRLFFSDDRLVLGVGHLLLGLVITGALVVSMVSICYCIFAMEDCFGRLTMLRSATFLCYDVRAIDRNFVDEIAVQICFRTSDDEKQGFLMVLIGHQVAMRKGVCGRGLRITSFRAH